MIRMMHVLCTGNNCVATYIVLLAMFETDNTGIFLIILFCVKANASEFAPCFSNVVNIMSALSDKVSLFIQQFSVFLVAMIMAVVVDWRLSLAVMSITPLMTGAMIATVVVSVKRFQNN